MYIQQSARVSLRYIWHPVRALHSRVQDCVSQLSGLPEYKSAVTNRLKGNVSAAISDMARVQDIARSVAPVGSILWTAASLRLSSLHIESGSNEEAERCLELNGLDISAEGRPFVEQGAALCHVLKGDLHSASRIFEQRQRSISGDLELLGGQLCLEGTLKAYAGNFNEAVVSFRKALECNCQLIDKIIAVNNAGASLCLSGGWRPLATTGHFKPLITSDSSSESRSGDADGAVAGLHRGLDYWSSAIDPAWLQAASNQNERSVLSRYTAITTAHLLCSRSEVYASLNKNDLASADINAALKILEPHVNDDTLGLSHSEAISAVGRAVTLLAHRHLFAAEAVTAEGFFRKAVACLRDRRVSNDFRQKSEAYAAMVGYSDLLKKWEKRESHGDKLLQDANSYMGSDCPVLFEGGIKVSQFIQLPIISLQ